MNTPSPALTPLSASPARPRRWLTRSLFALAWLAALVVLFYTVENWRGAHAQGAYRQTLGADGGPRPLASFIPPEMPDAENFAMTPFLTGVFDRKALGQVDKSRWPDDFQLADRFAGWIKAGPTDENRADRRLLNLAGWPIVFERIRAGETNADSATAEEIPLFVTGPAVDRAPTARAVLKTLQPYEGVLAELRAASQRRASRYNVHYDLENPWAILLPHLSLVKRISLLLRLKTTAELAAGHAEQGLDDAHLSLHLVESLKDEPFLISQLVRIACFQIAVQPIWEGLAERRWSEAQLQQLQTRLVQLDFLAGFQRSLDCERAAGSFTIEAIRDHRDSPILRGLTEGEQEVDSWEKDAVVVLQVCPRGWFDQEQLNYDRAFVELILPIVDAEAKRVYPGVSDQNEQSLERLLHDSGSLITQHRLFTKWLLPQLTGSPAKFGYAQAVADQAMVACALERYRLATGQFPETLAALVPQFLSQLPHDVVSGGPLQYRRTKDGQFVLYAVGWNQRDDGGIATWPQNKAPEGDWVWEYPAR